MNAEFLTTNSRLTIDKNWINENIIIKKPKNYWFDSFIFMALIIVFFIYEALTDNSYKWIIVFAGLTWILPHIKTVLQILFVETWKSNIQLLEIKDVKIEKQENELEEKVILRLKSGRRKTYVFRKSENQAENFIATINR